MLPRKLRTANELEQQTQVLEDQMKKRYDPVRV